MATTTTTATAPAPGGPGRPAEVFDATQIIRVSVPPKGIGTTLRAVKIVLEREILRFLNDRLRMVTVLLQPILNIFVLGTGLSVLAAGSGINLRTFIYPGAVGMAVMMTAVFSAGSIVWDREFGFLREMFVAPVSRTAIVIGKCLGGAIVATGQGVIVLAIAGLAGVPYNPLLLIELLGELALLAFTLTALGVMAAVRVPTFQGFMGLVQMFVLPMFFTAGAMFPLAGLPTWLTVITRVNPLTYAIDPIRRGIFERLSISPALRARYAGGITWDGWHVPILLELGVVLAMGLILLGVAILEFRKAE
jgi:ABC-2 type transport system permease protein